MKEIIESFFRERSLVNHQLASYDDCIPSGDNSLSRMEKIVRSIRVGTDEEVEDEKGGLIKLDVIDQDIIIRVKNIQLGEDGFHNLQKRCAHTTRERSSGRKHADYGSQP